jgi:hypothetical protein
MWLKDTTSYGCTAYPFCWFEGGYTYGPYNGHTYYDYVAWINPAGTLHLSILADIPTGQTGSVFLKIIRYNANTFNISYHSPNYYNDNIPANLQYGMSPNYIQIGMRLSGSNGVTSSPANFSNNCYIQGGICYPQTNPGNPSNGYVSSPPYGSWTNQPTSSNGGGQWTTKAQQYDRTAAAVYADTWAHNRNSYYFNYPTDCTNFVSQSMSAGGLPYIGGNVGDITAWWFHPPYGVGAQSVPAQNTKTWSTADLLNQHFSQYQGSRYQYVPRMDSSVQAGDVVIYQWAGETIPTHSRVLVGWGYSSEVVPLDEGGTYGVTHILGMLADQHTNDRKHVVWDDGILSGTATIIWKIIW